MSRPLIVKNQIVRSPSTTMSVFFNDAESLLHGPLSLTEQPQTFLSIDWDNLPLTFTVKYFKEYYHTIDIAQYRNSYAEKFDTFNFTKMSLKPVYFVNGFVGWSIQHNFPFGWGNTGLFDVAIWRRAFNVNNEHGMSPVGKYTFIRVWNTALQSIPISFTEEQYLNTHSEMEIIAAT